MKLNMTFSLREMLTALVVALAIALYVTRLELAKARALQGRVCALQEVLEGLGFEIQWHPESNSMTYGRDGGPWGGMSIPETDCDGEITEVCQFADAL
jgi:hypothetical protein